MKTSEAQKLFSAQTKGVSEHFEISSQQFTSGLFCTYTALHLRDSCTAIAW
jgi:hypothetical protein